MTPTPSASFFPEHEPSTRARGVRSGLARKRSRYAVPLRRGGHQWLDGFAASAIWRARTRLTVSTWTTANGPVTISERFGGGRPVSPSPGAPGLTFVGRAASSWRLASPVFRLLHARTRRAGAHRRGRPPRAHAPGGPAVRVRASSPSCHRGKHRGRQRATAGLRFAAGVHQLPSLRRRHTEDPAAVCARAYVPSQLRNKLGTLGGVEAVLRALADESRRTMLET